MAAYGTNFKPHLVGGGEYLAHDCYCKDHRVAVVLQVPLQIYVSLEIGEVRHVELTWWLHLLNLVREG